MGKTVVCKNVAFSILKKMRNSKVWGEIFV